MLELYIAEGRRFARLAAAVAALHLIVLVLLDRLLPMLRDSADICGLVGSVYGVGGVIFGAYQAATYARMNHWIALIHRPLAPWRIMAGVVGAGASVVVVAILPPLLLWTAGLTLEVGRVVDARHWVLTLSGALIGVIGFLVGTYVALAPRRYGWTALVAVILAASSNAGGVGAPLFQALVIAIFVPLVAGAFRPDRTVAPTNPGLLAPTAGIAALSIFVLLLIGSGFAYQMTLVALGRNPLINVPPRGGLVEASRSDSDDLIDAALASSTAAAAPEVRARLRGVEVRRLPVPLGWLPYRGELTNPAPIGFVDARRSVEWTYSHDANAFLGVRLKDRQDGGVLRPAGGFSAPPLLIDGGMMIAGSSLFRFDAAKGTIDRRLTLPDGEVLLTRTAPVDGVVAVFGDRTLRLVDQRVLGAGPVPAGVMVMPMPGKIGDLRRFDMARLPEGFVVSFFFGRDSVEGPSAAWQRVVLLRPDGSVRTLAQRSLGPDLADGLRFRAYWLSPALYALADAAEWIGAVRSPIVERAPIRVPRTVWIAAGLLSLVSAAGAVLLARRRRLSVPATAAWTLAAGAFGLPMLLAFLLMGRPPRT